MPKNPGTGHSVYLPTGDRRFPRLGLSIIRVARDDDVLPAFRRRYRVYAIRLFAFVLLTSRDEYVALRTRPVDWSCQ